MISNFFLLTNNFMENLDAFSVFLLQAAHVEIGSIPI